LLTTSPANRTDVAVHWDGGRNPKNAEDEIVLLKAYHNWHNNQKRFPNRGGFPYNLAVGPITGNVYEGRGLQRIGAAVGGRNTKTISIIVIGGPGNLTDAAKRGLKEAYALANKYAGRVLGQGVHSDFNATSCPGDALRSFVKAGGLVGGDLPDGGGSGGGGHNFKPGDITVRGVTVKNVQDRILAHNPKALPKWGADGKMGDETIKWIMEFQGDQKIVKDGIVGSVTWSRLESDPKPDIEPEPAPPWPFHNYQFIGPEGLGDESISGHHGGSEHVRRFQQRLKDRGWTITADGRASYTKERVIVNSQTGKVARAFQREKGLPATGGIDARTWAAAWEAPIT